MKRITLVAIPVLRLFFPSPPSPKPAVKTMPAIGGDPFAEDEAEDRRLLIGLFGRTGETTCQLGCQIREMHHQQQVLS